MVRQLNRELAKAREEVCDNFVLASTDATIYSRTLLSLSQLVQRGETMPGSVGFFASRWKLEQRVAGLLDESRDRTTFLSKRGWAFVFASTLGLAAAICLGTVTIATAQNSTQDAAVKPEPDSTSMTISGLVRGQNGDPIAGAKIWLAVMSHQHESQGSLRELGTADDQGRFKTMLDVATTDAFCKRPYFWQTQLVATAPGRGLDWMPLDVFEDNPAASEKRATLRTRIDKAFGGRTLRQPGTHAATGVAARARAAGRFRRSSTAECDGSG